MVLISMTVNDLEVTLTIWKPCRPYTCTSDNRADYGQGFINSLIRKHMWPTALTEVWKLMDFWRYRQCSRKHVQQLKIKLFFLYFEKSKTYLPLQAFLDVIFRTVVQRFQQSQWCLCNNCICCWSCWSGFVLLSFILLDSSPDQQNYSGYYITTANEFADLV